MIVISRALPNPAGKDRRPQMPPTNEQLNSEWLEIANSGAHSESVDGLRLSHYTFAAQCTKTGEDTLMTLSGTLAAGHVVRFHSGSGSAWTDGAVRHLYLGRSNYAWNNACGDTAVLRNSAGQWTDYAQYEPFPAEGAILNRVPGTHTLAAARAARTA